MKSQGFPKISYVSGLKNWHDNTTVEIKSDTSELTFSEEEYFFPPELVPLVSHEICLDKDRIFFKEILVHSLYAYLDFTEVLESTVVNPVSFQIARGEIGIDLPYEAKLDAYRICVDESFHALRSAEMKQKVQIATGICPIKLGNPAFLEELNKLQDVTSSEIKKLLKVFFVIITETAITGNLSRIPKNHQVVKAVRDLARDHAQDERGHSIYFESLLQFLWHDLSLYDRIKIGSILPDLISIYLKQDLEIIKTYLRVINLGSDEIISVLSEAYSETKESQRMQLAIKPTLTILKRNGVFDYPDIVGAFEKSGFYIG